MASRSKHPISEINVVPYIDVMLVLLIIFMVTVPLIQQGVEVDLPEAPAEIMDSTEIPDPLIITVDAHGRISMNKGELANRPIDIRLLSEFVQTLLSDVKGKVYVRGDADADYSSVIRVMVTLQNAGATSIGLITRTPETPEQ